MKKKAQTPIDIVYLAIIGLILAIFFFIGYLFINQIKTTNDNNNEFMGTEATKVINKADSIMPNVFDIAFILFMVGIIIVNFVSAFQIRSHPVFFIVSFFMLVILVVPFAMFSNIFGSLIAGGEGLGLVKSHFVWIPYLMDKFPLWMVAINLITAIVVYSKGD
jgi:hypothetical protein